jgi:hypothetical protein
MCTACAAGISQIEDRGGSVPQTQIEGQQRTVNRRTSTTETVRTIQRRRTARPRATEARLLALLACCRVGVRVVTYRDAERDAERLAALLLSTFGRREIARYGYVAIPRGGFFVLGWLSYMLNLSRDALRPRGGGRPLVVVDDCCLTGFRFHQFLASVRSGKTIFAHLYSHPAVRRAIEDAETRVLGCFAACDLRDISRECFPRERDRATWQRHWRARMKGPRYWIGLSEWVVLPWNEPDRLLWNPSSRRVERGWRLASPDLCLKNRFQLGLPPRLLLRESLRASNRVAYRLAPDEVLLCNLRTERVYRLKGVSAAMWRALAACGNIETAADHLSRQYAAEPSRIRRDLDAFAKDLIRGGLLESVEQVPGGHD